jgi:hypothetical protein
MCFLMIKNLFSSMIIPIGKDLENQGQDTPTLDEHLIKVDQYIRPNH